MKVATIIKLVLAVVALCFWGGWCYFNEKFLSDGTKAASATHSILVNDHGTFVYITPTQGHVLTLMTVAAVASFSCAVIIDLYERNRGRLH